MLWAQASLRRHQDRDRSSTSVASPGDEKPAGLEINLATAMRLAGVNPLDIAAATVQVRQGLALLLQAKVLWIPNLNAGVDYFRHDGFSQNLFTGGAVPKGPAKIFRRRRTQLERCTHRCDFRAAGRAGWSRHARPTFRRRRNKRPAERQHRRTSSCKRRGGGWSASMRRSCGAEAGRFGHGIGSGVDCTAGDQPGEDRATKLEANSGNRDPGLAGCRRQSGGSPSTGSRGFARADRAPVRRDYADSGRPDGRGAGPDRAQQPARDRLAEGAARRGRTAIAPGKETPILA